MRLTTAAAGAASLLLVAGLAACSGEPEPGAPLPTGEPAASASTGVEATPSSSPGEPVASPEPETTETPVAAPTLPPEATTNDAAGAEAFTWYWYEALNYAYATGDLAPVRAVSADDCRICEALGETIADAYADGGRLEGGFIRLTEVVAPTPDATGSVLLSIVYDQAPSVVVRGDGDRGELSSGDSQLGAGVVIERTADDAQWQMYGVGE